MKVFDMNIFNYPNNYFLLPEYDAKMSYVMFAHSTGDTFNGLVQFLKVLPLCEFSLIIKKQQFELVEFILRLSQKKPVNIFIYDHFPNDFTMKFFSENNKIIYGGYGYFPYISQAGIYNWGHSSFEDKRVNQLNTNDVQVIANHFVTHSPKIEIPDDSVILFPNYGTGKLDIKWHTISNHILQKYGYKVFCNASGKTEYPNEAIHGVDTLEISQLELLANLYYKKNIKLLGVRSGIFDLLRFCSLKMLILYMDEVVWRGYKAFEVNNISQMYYPTDVFELILQEGYESIWEQQIITYVDQFLLTRIPDDVIKT